MAVFRMSAKGRRDLLNAAFVSADLTRRARIVANAANANAPVGETGELSTSHGVTTDHTDRARAAIYSTAEHAIIVESRTGYLSRALDGGSE